MSQINIYVPDELERKLKSTAKAKSKSLSALIVELVTRAFGKPRGKRDPRFLKVLGSLSDDFPDEIPRAGSQEREPL